MSSPTVDKVLCSAGASGGVEDVLSSAGPSGGFEDVLSSAGASGGVEDVLGSTKAGGKVIRGSIWRVAGNGAGVAAGLGTAALLLRHLGVAESGRYVTVISLVAIALTVADAGLNITGSRELALHAPRDRRALIADLLGLRLTIAPVALAGILCFTILAGYPQRMVLGVMLAGAGLLVVALADTVLLRLTVELRNAGLALIDFLKQAVMLAGVAVLVALDAPLTPFFAVQIVVGLVVVGLVPLLIGRGALVMPRFDRGEQRALLGRSLPLAVSIVLGQLYFRLVIVLMSLSSSPQQTGYFGGSLRAMEALVGISLLAAGVALPLLATAARDDRARLRYTVTGLSEGAVVIGVLVVLVAARAAVPLMTAIGGEAFRPAGTVLSIQAFALLFAALNQIWMVSLVALGRQRELILTNAFGLLCVAVFAIALVGPLGARGGAIASVLGDASLAALVYWRLRASIGRFGMRIGFLVRVALAAGLASAVLMLVRLPDLVVGALAGAVFLGAGQLIGILPRELRDALWPRHAKPGLQKQ